MTRRVDTKFFYDLGMPTCQQNTIFNQSISKETSRKWSDKTWPPRPFDGQNQYSVNCSQYQKPIQHKKLGCSCLGQEHQVKDCPSKLSCGKRKHLHHSTLPDDQKQERSQFNPSQKPNHSNYLTRAVKTARGWTIAGPKETDNKED